MPRKYPCESCDKLIESPNWIVVKEANPKTGEPEKRVHVECSEEFRKKQPRARLATIQLVRG